MGVKYATSFASNVGPPVTTDLAFVPPFSDVVAANDDAGADRAASSSNVVVLDASGGLARYLKPHSSAGSGSPFCYQSLFARVAADVAALRALGYEPVPFLDATIPLNKLAVWKARRREEHKSLLRMAERMEQPNYGPPHAPDDRPGAGGGGHGSRFPATLSFSKNDWVPPEAATQHLADAFAAAGCEVHLGVADVDAEAAAYCRAVKAHAVLTCDSDFFVMDLGPWTRRVWHWEHFDLAHRIWGWLPPEGSPGVLGPTRRAPAPGSEPSPHALPRFSLREIRVDLLRKKLRLDGGAPHQMAFLAACLGNDGVPHIRRDQIERIEAEHPLSGVADAQVQTPEPVRRGGGLDWEPVVPRVRRGGGGYGWGGGGGGRFGGGGRGYGGGGDRGPPGRVVELLAHELSRQLSEGLIEQPTAAGAGAGDDDDNSNAATATAAAVDAAVARAVASNPRCPVTAAYVARRVATYGAAALEMYEPDVPMMVEDGPGAGSGLEAAAPGSKKSSNSNNNHSRPDGSFRGGRSGARALAPAPNVVRVVVMHAGVMVKGQRTDDVREAPVFEVARDLRMRVYAGAGVKRVRELLYHPLPPSSQNAAAAATGPLGEMRALLDALPGQQQEGGATQPPPYSRPNPGLAWNDEFVEVVVEDEMAALGKCVSPLLPTSPEIVAAKASGEALVAFACSELLRLELITPYEAELLKRQASPDVRRRVRAEVGAETQPLRGGKARWRGTNGEVIACMRSVRVSTLLTTMHTWVAFLLDNHAPTIESVLDVRVFNELWRREVDRLEREPQPGAALQRVRWVREHGPPPQPQRQPPPAMLVPASVAVASASAPALAK